MNSSRLREFAGVTLSRVDSEGQFHPVERLLRLLRRLKIFLSRGTRLIAEPDLHGAHVDSGAKPAGRGATPDNV